MGGSAQWELQRESLGKYHQIIAVDLPGFGKNNHLKAPDRITGFAEFVLDHLVQRDIGSFDLLGHSMGGMIVQEMMTLAPESIQRLVLYGTASTGNLPGRFETFETSRRRVTTDGVVASARRISATWFLEYDRSAQFDNCARLAEESSPQALMAALDAMESWDQTKNLSQINNPTLVVWGEADRTYRWPNIEKLWTTIPDASLAVLPGCSHAAHMEKPELFNAVVNDFLQ